MDLYWRVIVYTEDGAQLYETSFEKSYTLSKVVEEGDILLKEKGGKFFIIENVNLVYSSESPRRV